MELRCKHPAIKTAGHRGPPSKLQSACPDDQHCSDNGDNVVELVTIGDSCHIPGEPGEVRQLTEGLQLTIDKKTKPTPMRHSKHRSLT